MQRAQTSGSAPRLAPAAAALTAPSRSQDGVTNVRVVLIGQSGVGKTSLLGRIIHNTYDDDSRATLGIDFVTKTVMLRTRTQERIPVRLQCWDTAGAARFHDLMPAYVRDAAICIVVYDAGAGTHHLDAGGGTPRPPAEQAVDYAALAVDAGTDERALRERLRAEAVAAQRAAALVWARFALEQTHPHCALIVVGSKIDLLTPEERYETVEAQRAAFAMLCDAVRAQDAERHVGFVRASAKTGEGDVAMRTALGDAARAFLERSGLLEGGASAQRPFHLDGGRVELGLPLPAEGGGGAANGAPNGWRGCAC